MSADIV